VRELVDQRLLGTRLHQQPAGELVNRPGFCGGSNS